MPTLILLRHGQSVWNAANRFTGWIDVDLTDRGEREAVRAGHLLADHRLLPTVVHTSLQKRAIRTANLALDACDRAWIPVRRDWRLNERHYGALTGLDKAETVERHGSEQVHEWRRSYDTPPPPLEPGSEHDLSEDPRYEGVPVPATECLADVVARMVPYWDESVTADLRAGHTVMVSAHGNSLRALVKHLDRLGDDEISGINIPTGIPLVYELDPSLEPAPAPDAVPPLRGRYLDPDAATAGAAEVAAQTEA